jgi:hypothetical protein
VRHADQRQYRDRLGFGRSNIPFGISVPAAFADYANDVGSAIILTVNP